MAMETLNLSGITVGDSLQVSVSQNGLTAGPYSIGSWGGGADGGTIAIKAIHRSLHQIAPDSIRFEVDFSQASFDTPGPDAGTPYYDPRMHELIYLWDMGDPGTWNAPVNVLPAWKNRNVAKGPSVKHLYRDPGNYTVSVLVIEPSSGKTARAELVVSVGDPQDFYGDINTIYINNIGDNDWSYVPAGVPEANKVNVDSLEQIGDNGVFKPDSLWSSRKRTSCRWRFKRGGSWTVCIYMHSGDAADPMFDDYGDPNEHKPEWTVKTANSPSESVILRSGYAFDQANNDRLALWNDKPPEVRLRNIRFQGTFDAVANYGLGGPYMGATYFGGGIRCYTADCKFDGFGSSTFYSQTGNRGGDCIHDLHLDNCAFSNFGGEYVVMWVGSDHEESAIATTGVRWEQPGDARNAKSGFLGSRSALRAGARFNHARGCDVFHTDESQPGLTFWKTPITDGALINVHSVGIEGGSTGIAIAGNYASTPEKRSYTGNAIIDGLIYVANNNSGVALGANMTGVTVRNVLAIWPEVSKAGNGCNGLVQFEPLALPGVTIPDYVLDAPIKVYNNTLRMDRTMAQNSQTNSYVPRVFDRYKPPNDDWKNPGSPSVPQPFSAVLEANNVLHFPNLIAWPNTTEVNPEHVAFAPLSENVLWQARYLGYRDPETGVLDSQYAVPSDAVKDTKPLTGSAALGAALTGDVSYMDTQLQKRPEPPSMGAWEAE